MKTIHRLFCLFLCTLLFGSGMIHADAKEAFTIEHLDITMYVNEDGTYEIEEVYTLDFTEYRHGFYRTIPTRYEMKWTDDSGNAQYENYYFPIDQISCGDAKTCATDVDSGGVMIQIGDPDKTIIGLQNYTIRYRVHTKDLGVQNQQMLYWNLIGNGFDTTIRSMDYHIVMPKAFDASKISAYTGAYGAAYENLSYQVNGNEISGSLLSSLDAHESATILIPLEEGYFHFPQPKDYLLYAIVASTLIALCSLVLFWRFGKDDEVVVTVEFEAPEGLDSAAVGYVVDSMVDQRDMLSLIMDWADRGYIKIHEDEKHHLSLEKIKELGAEAKPYEQKFFQSIFKNKDFVSEADLRKSQVSQGMSAAQQMVSQYFRKKERRIFTGSSVSLQVLMCLFVALPSFLCAMAALYMRYEMMEMTYFSFLLLAFGIVVAIPWIILMRKRYVIKRSSYFLLWGLCFLLNGIIFAITVIMMLLMGGSLAWLYALIYLALELLQMFILMFMDKRTKQGNRWLGQILGLREFILTCEKERLELLVKEDPQAFFHVLPYAYVLGVSDVWANKFEHLIIPQPQWYVGPTYGDTFSAWLWWNGFHYRFHRLSESIRYVETKQISGGSGGAHFGGFGGGGGFSGGGFGGGGGGSW